MDNEHCRFCGNTLKHIFVDLGMSPLANGYLTENDLEKSEKFYLLKVKVCSRCFLVQADVYQQPEQIFGDYKYFSSYSSDWLAHCKKYADMIIRRLALHEDSKVLEIACNDGYLLQYFQAQNIYTKGIEPAETVAGTARSKGLDVESFFFSEKTARDFAQDNGTFDLVIGNNVLAHVPDINSFVEGLSVVLSPQGTLTMEFPHLLQLIKNAQFDTIYHEHFFYLSFGAVNRIFQKHGLKIYDVERLETHGGSLRIYAAHEACDAQQIRPSVAELLQNERDFGLETIDTYTNFSQKMLQVKLKTLQVLTDMKGAGKRIAAFGAAAKGNTFLNYCGLKNDMIDFVVDSNPHKQGLLLPGSLIPIMSPEILHSTRPDILLILPWNLAREIMEAASCIREWGGRFMTCIPDIWISD